MDVVADVIKVVGADNIFGRFKDSPKEEGEVIKHAENEFLVRTANSQIIHIDTEGVVV